VDLKKIREEFNKEFEWDGPPLALRALKKNIGILHEAKTCQAKAVVG